jgi:hypothetical protein
MEDRMPWNDIAWVEHRRICARYPSDLTDREWALIEPLLPMAKPGGRRRTTDLRTVYDAILYIASSGCQSLPGKRHIVTDCHRHRKPNFAKIVAELPDLGHAVGAPNR